MIHQQLMIEDKLPSVGNSELPASCLSAENPATGTDLRIRMSEAEIDVLRRCLGESKNYLEYGAGGSTRLALTFPGICSITSVESDPKFIATEFSENAAAEAAIQSGRLRFLMPDIGTTGAWGCPVNHSKEHLWPLYALSPFLEGCVPDVILIDGRFRVACGLAAALEAPAATILIHDYSLRPEYRVLERFLNIEDRADTLVRCRVRSDLDQRQAQKFLRAYLFSPVDNGPVRLRLARWKRAVLRLTGR